jgi:hypothetical protein
VLFVLRSLFAVYCIKVVCFKYLKTCMCFVIKLKLYFVWKKHSLFIILRKSNFFVISFPRIQSET